MWAAVKDGDLVSARRETFDDRPADEKGAADHENAHAGIIDRGATHLSWANDRQ
jgi:hypothetical protein